MVRGRHELYVSCMYNALGNGKDLEGADVSTYMICQFDSCIATGIAYLVMIVETVNFAPRTMDCANQPL